MLRAGSAWLVLYLVTGMGFPVLGKGRPHRKTSFLPAPSYGRIREVLMSSNRLLYYQIATSDHPNALLECGMIGPTLGGMGGEGVG